MLTINDGPEFLGYGTPRTCPHCKNRNYEHICFSSNEIGILNIPISVSRFPPMSICPICRRAYGTVKLEYLNELLDAGKEATKQHYSKLNFVERARYRRGLKYFKAHALLRYLAS